MYFVVLLVRQWTISVTEKNKEQVQENPPGYIYNIAFVLLIHNIAFVLFIQWYHQEHNFVGFGILSRLVNFTNDI